MAIQIDGSQGEGGGQILRSSLSLSLVTGQPFRIEGIRAGRERPGLLRQHLTAVLAAAEVGGAKVAGATLGSTALTFEPGAVKAGKYHFSVGTAGSATLVFQTVLPALMLAAHPSRVTLEGGTHNMAAPPFDFLQRTFLPLIERMGPRVQLRLERYGFYPAGGGRMVADIQPVAALQPLLIGERGPLTSRRITAIVANLDTAIAEREVKAAARELGWGPESYEIIATRDSDGPGNVVMIEAGSPQVNEIFTSFGERGVRAETVAASAARQALEYFSSRAAACEHLTDQLLLPLALAGAGSFTSIKSNPHAVTNMEVISRFLPVRFAVHAADGYQSVEVLAGA